MLWRFQSFSGGWSVCTFLGPGIMHASLRRPGPLVVARNGKAPRSAFGVNVRLVIEYVQLGSARLL